MKKTIKKILIISGWTVLVCSLIVILGFVNNKHNQQHINEISIYYKQAEHCNFVDDKTLIAALNKAFDSIQNRPVQSIKLEDIESVLKENPYIREADAHISVNGKLEIFIKQKKPVFRFINKNGKSAYYNLEGSYIPLHPEKTVHTILIHGHFKGDLPKKICPLDPTKETKVNEINKAYSMAFTVGVEIINDPFLSAMIDQIYLTEQEQIELIPRTGNHVVVIGDGKDLNTRLSKLKTFYKKGLGHEGWDTYKTINLTFSNQVVCTKY